MFHQSYAHVQAVVVSETKSCCANADKEKSCCKKTTPCKEKSCCTYVLTAAVAIVENQNYTLHNFEENFEKQAVACNPLFIQSPDYSIWQPPKISLNL